MMESYVRSANYRTISVGVGVPTRASPARRALIAELSFEVFTRFAGSEVGFVPGAGGYLPPGLQRSVARYISDLAGTPSPELHKPLTVEERVEVGRLSARLLEFFGPRFESEPWSLRPPFRGCGLVDDAHGDVLVGQTLYEVKTVDRGFRAVDFRQLLVYAALHHADTRDLLQRGAIFNPRLGDFFGFDFERLSAQVAGVSQVELVSSIIDHISGSDISL